MFPMEKLSKLTLRMNSTLSPQAGTAATFSQAVLAIFPCSLQRRINFFEVYSIWKLNNIPPLSLAVLPKFNPIIYQYSSWSEINLYSSTSKTNLLSFWLKLILCSFTNKLYLNPCDNLTTLWLVGSREIEDLNGVMGQTLWEEPCP